MSQTIRLDIDLSQLTVAMRGIEREIQNLKSVFTQLDSSINNIGSSSGKSSGALGTLAGALGGLAVVGKLGDSMKGFIGVRKLNFDIALIILNSLKLSMWYGRISH